MNCRKFSSSLFAVITTSILLLASCIDKPEPVDPGGGGGGGGEHPSGGVDNVADLKINSFSLRPEDNERIYGEVKFASNSDGTEWTGVIEHYRADLKQLIATFDVDADRVTVGGVEQVSGETANNFSSTVVYRLYTTKNEYREFRVTVENPADSYTGFPILALMTEGAKPVVSRDDWIKGRMVIDRQAGDCAEFAGDIEIKGRGHNTWGQPKKPYAVKLASKSELMGMNKHKRWVLLANAGDKTLLRNRVAYEIGRRTELPWTPHNRYVDVIMNGEFVGSYLLCEQIRVDKNRVDITEAESGMAADAVGYLLELDRYYDEPIKFRSQYMDLPVNVKDPDEEVITTEQRQYIADYINKVEQLLYGGATVDPAYRNYIDLDTFIDWWMVVELTGNRDPRLPGSCYMYKDAGGKLCAGPLWDFDLTTFTDSKGFRLYDYTIDPDDKSQTDRSLWYGKLFTDPEFKARAKERWNRFRPAFGTIEEFIDAEADKIAVSAKSNWDIWTLTESGSNRDETLSWEEAVAQMKINYRNRLEWMDAQIGQW